MSEYSVEEVRAIVDRSIDALRDNKETFQASELEKVHMWIAERIKADEGAVPVAMVVSRSGDPEEFGERAIEYSDAIQKLPYNTPLFAHPPAQAAQVDDNAALVEAMKLPDGYEVVEHLPGIWGYEYDRDDGERMASSASWNHPALAAIGAWQDHVEALAESAEPATQGEVVKRWPFVESPGEFTSRLQVAMHEFPLLGAVRHVLIEDPPTLAAQPRAVPETLTIAAAERGLWKRAAAKMEIYNGTWLELVREVEKLRAVATSPGGSA